MPGHIGRWFAGFAVVAVATSVTTATVYGQATPAGAPAAQRSGQPPDRNVIKDSWMTFKIHSQFLPDDALEGSDVDVDTVGGVVTLSGTVVSEKSRARALAIAKATDGVKSVNDKLTIAAAAPGVTWPKAQATGAKAGTAVADGWIKSKIYAQYLTDWNVFDDSDLDIDVEKGVVTLNGTVESTATKTRAVSIAKATDGVKSVNDKLKVVAP